MSKTSKTSPRGQRILLLTVDVHVTFDVVKLPLMKQDLRSLFAVDLKILAGFYFLEFQCLYNWIFLSQLMTYGIFICEQQTGAWKL